MTERKRRPPKKLGDVMGEMLSKAGISDRIAQAQVFPEWRALVGEQIARVTEPLSVTPQGTLFVSVETNAWMTELSLLEPELLKQINRRTGKLQIRRIRWQIRR